MMAEMQIPRMKMVKGINFMVLLLKVLQILPQHADFLAVWRETAQHTAFTQFDFPDENGRPYRSSGGEMTYSAELKRSIPMGWKVGKLGNIVKKRTEAAVSDSSLQCIDLSVMPTGSISIVESSAGDEFESNMKKMYKFDILFGGIRPYLKKAGIAPFDGLRAGTVHAFYPIKSAHYNFSLITITSESVFNYAIQKSGGNTRMPSVSANDLLEYPLAYSEEYISLYQDKLTGLSELLVRNVIEIQKLTELRDWLLPMLMTGQVRVEASA